MTVAISGSSFHVSIIKGSADLLHDSTPDLTTGPCNRQPPVQRPNMSAWSRQAIGRFFLNDTPENPVRNVLSLRDFDEVTTSNNSTENQASFYYVRFDPIISASTLIVPVLTSK